ncbi:unnamed protein product [Paramecium sonneborni]|uniref:Uncharacterized protein n=1 Tax=Paramecium sonneborni TaxID=65129 RepID=A0A8S1R4H6_9CILI|nr:unnamed protein product [Paramecium sonneborni]
MREKRISLSYITQTIISDDMKIADQFKMNLETQTFKSGLHNIEITKLFEDARKGHLF